MLYADLKATDFNIMRSVLDYDSITLKHNSDAEVYFRFKIKSYAY